MATTKEFSPAFDNSYYQTKENPEIKLATYKVSAKRAVTKVKIKIGKGVGTFTVGKVVTGNANIPAYIKIGSSSKHSKKLSITNKVSPNSVYGIERGQCKWKTFSFTDPPIVAKNKSKAVTIHFTDPSSNQCFCIDKTQNVKVTYCSVTSINDDLEDGITGDIISEPDDPLATFYVYYNLNGGSGYFPTQAFLEESGVNLHSHVPVRNYESYITFNSDGGSACFGVATNYPFLWWVDSDGYGWDPGEEYWCDETTTMTAQWGTPKYPTLPTPSKSCIIYYSANGGYLTGIATDSVACTFSGWSTEYRTGYWAVAGNDVIANMLYAYWTYNAYTAHSSASRASSKFMFWTTIVNNESSRWVDGTIVDSDITLYAFWAYSITFITTGGVLNYNYVKNGQVHTDSSSSSYRYVGNDPNNGYIYHGHNFTIPDFVMSHKNPDNSASDREFKGWSTSPGGRVKYKAGSIITMTEPLTLYAVWEKKSFKVTFRKGYGNNARLIPDQSVPYGESATPPRTPKRKGHTFAGWSRSFKNVKADITVYALWDFSPIHIFRNRYWQPYLPTDDDKDDSGAGDGNTIDNSMTSWDLSRNRTIIHHIHPRLYAGSAVSATNNKSYATDNKSKLSGSSISVSNPTHWTWCQSQLFHDGNYDAGVSFKSTAKKPFKISSIGIKCCACNSGGITFTSYGHSSPTSGPSPGGSTHAYAYILVVRKGTVKKSKVSRVYIDGDSPNMNHRGSSSPDTAQFGEGDRTWNGQAIPKSARLDHKTFVITDCPEIHKGARVYICWGVEASNSTFYRIMLDADEIELTTDPVANPYVWIFKDGKWHLSHPLHRFHSGKWENADDLFDKME